jgi:hypothetical protein
MKISGPVNFRRLAIVIATGVCIAAVLVALQGRNEPNSFPDLLTCSERSLARVHWPFKVTRVRLPRSGTPGAAATG